MPKEAEKEVKDAIKRQSPYRRGDAPCTLFLRKKILYRKNSDGTLNHEVQTVSNKWWDGTLTCKSGTERPDIWVVKAEVDKGLRASGTPSCSSTCSTPSGTSASVTATTHSPKWSLRTLRPSLSPSPYRSKENHFLWRLLALERRLQNLFNI